MRLLARRDHSIGEFRQKLRQRGVEEAIVDDLVDRFSEQNYLDDERFASHQSELLVAQQWGPLKIRQKLAARGIEGVLIERELQAIGRERFLEAGRQRLARKQSAGDGSDRREQERLFRHLVSRGFSAEMARQLIFDAQPNSER